ncbi:MAG: RNA polymerase subunit sigma-24 [Chlorobiales bacterium]|nr:RNA polymerase subunit sigma-24 [Chlorobiales bacterium]
MIKAKRTPLDLIDDIYSLAYWLTSSEAKAMELVHKTYLQADHKSSETELFKTFRVCYLESIGQHDALDLPETPCFSKETPEPEFLKQHAADIRLSVLLSEISKLKHRTISRIIGKPLDTIRLWLSAGRKSLANGIRFECLVLDVAGYQRSEAS